MPTSLGTQVQSSVAIGTTVQLATTLPADAAGLSYDWDLGDGTRSTESRPSHSYAAAGPYTWRVTVSNGAGQSVSASGVLLATGVDRLLDAPCDQTTPTGACAYPALGQGRVRAMDCVDAYRCAAVGELGYAAFSVDSGASWTVTRAPTLGRTLAHVLMVNASTAYAYTRIGQTLGPSLMVRTTDAGRSWQRVNAVASPLDRCYPVVGPCRLWALGQDVLVYGSGGEGFAYISRDGGQNWTKLSYGFDGGLSDPTGGLLWSRDGRYLSLDLGLTGRDLWPTVAAGRELQAKAIDDTGRIRMVVAQMIDGERRFVQVHSTNYGLTTEETLVQLPSLSANERMGGFLLRADGSGHAWTEIWPSTTSFLRTAGALLTTADGGRTWQRQGSLVGEAQAALNVTITRLNDNQLWIAFDTQDQSKNGAGVLLNLPSGERKVLQADGFLPLTLLTSNGNTLTALSSPQGAIVSRDQGNSWRPLPWQSATASPDALP